MISGVTIRNFRGITSPVSVDFRTVTLLSGRNGLGKTTLFDAIDWCLFGDAWRLGPGDDAARNLYASGDPSVTVTAQIDGQQVAIARTIGAVAIDGRSVSERELTDHLLIDPDVFPPYTRDLGARVRRFLYLPQAEILSIVRSSSADDRATQFAALEGVPNAAVITSAMRRLRERLEGRSSQASDRLVLLNTEIAAASDTDNAAVLAQTEEEGIVLADAAVQLGPDRAKSLEAAIAATGVEKERLRGDLTSGDMRRAAIVQLLKSQKDVADDLARSEQALAALVAAKNAAAQDAAGVEARHAEAEARWKRAQEAVAKGEETLALARARLTRSEELASLRQRASVADKEVLAQRSALGAVKARAAELRKVRSDVASQCEARRKQVEVARRQKELQEKTRQLELASAELQSLELAEKSNAASLASISKMLEAARAAHEQALVRMGGFERLQAHLGDVGRVTRDLQLADCPLCGQRYRSPDELLEHMRATFKGSFSAPRNAVDRTGLNELEKRRADTMQEAGVLSRRQAELAQVEMRLRSEVAGLSKVLGEVAPIQSGADDVASLEVALEVTEGRSRQLEGEVSEAAKVVEAESARMAAAEESLATIRASISALSVEVGSGASDAEVTNVTVMAVELGPLYAEIQDAQNALSSRSDERVRLSALLRDVEVRTAEHQARVSAQQQELRDIRSRLHELGANTSEWKQHLDADVVQAQERLSEVEILEQRLKWAAANRMRTRALEARAALEAEALSVVRSQREIAAALERLGVFERAAQDAIEAASRTTRGALHAAIQECLSALYPHRHLDRVIVDRGAVLLGDERLDAGVDPELYASSGQINVLALAVFLGCSARQNVSRLPLILLDEPVQSMDDVHFLAFVGLLKRFALSHQVVVSTADRNAAEVIARQFRSSSAMSQRFVQQEWKGFDPISGPIVVKHPAPLGRTHRSA